MKFTYISRYIQKLLQNRSSIITEWINNSDVQNIFEKHNLNSEEFESTFAYKIFEYYIGIFENRHEIGHCPDMEQFLNFFIAESVTPDEIFMICTNFRRSLIRFMYKENIASLELIDEINLIADKNIQNMINYFHSIYKKDETDLKNKQKTLLQAQKIAKTGHWELDLRKDSLYWSDEVYRIFGVKPKGFDATYESFLDMIHPKDIDMVNIAYNNSVKNKTPYKIVHRIITPENVLKYVQERGEHHIDKDGNVFRSIGTIRDITDEINAQKEIKLAAQLFKHSNDAVIITDEDNKIVMINEKFTKLTGYSIDEIKGKNPQLFSAGWGDKEFYKNMWSSIINNGVWKGEVWDRTKSGDIYAANLTILCVKDENNNITNYIGITNDITQKKEYEHEIKQLAYFDTLTKLPNRVHFRENVKSFIQSYESHKRNFALLFMDLDNFKWLNDSMGHKLGNKALIEVTKRIESVLHEDTFFCRMGGDEFALFCTYSDISEITALAQKIMISSKKPISLPNRDVTFGLSIGISTFPENGSSYGELLQSADTAMYQAKENGKNGFVFFTHEMNENSIRRLDIDTQLRQAIQNDSFSMLYQPKVSLETSDIYGAEALIRWNDPLLGFISPDIFIPIAEQSKLIEDIGYWVIKRSLQDFRKVLLSTKDDLVVSINISAKQFKDPDFVKNVSEIISESNVNTKNIEFEITETAIMDNITVIIHALKEIKELGISISIDDFGTGHSSMAYLKKLPINTIKIDRAFVKDVDIDKDDKAIIEAIIKISKQLNLKTIAEGIETQEHESILYDMGVDNGQGYLYSKPILYNELIELINLIQK